MSITAIKREWAWKQMVLEWRQEQLIWPRLNCHPRSVSQLSATYPMCFAPTTVPQTTVMNMNIMSSLSLLCVKAPPMVGPTWTRVRLTLGSDCLPTLFQGTALPLSRVSWTAYCSHVNDLMLRMIQGCISTLHSSMSPWGLFRTSYFVCLQGTSYPMTDYYVYNWRRVLRPASADALQASLRFYYWYCSYCTQIAVL